MKKSQAKVLNEYLFKEGIQMAIKHLKRCPGSLLEKSQSKLRSGISSHGSGCHLPKDLQRIKCCQGRGEQSILLACGVRVFMGGCNHEGKPWRFLKTLNTDVTHDKASPPLALDLEKIIRWFLNHLKWFVHPSFQGSTVDAIQDRASTRVSINREAKRRWNTLSYPKEWRSVIVRSMEGLRFIILSEVSPRGKEIYHWWVQSINSHKWTNL